VSNDFVWPSDRARAENDDLDRVCVQLEETTDQLAAMSTRARMLENIISNSHLADSPHVMSALNSAPEDNLASRDYAKRSEGAAWVGGLLIDEHEDKFAGGEVEILLICDEAIRRLEANEQAPQAAADSPLERGFEPPRIPVVWDTYRHENGKRYRVELVTNTNSQRPGYPITVCYRGEDGRVWSKPLVQFLAKMTRVEAA